MTTEALPSAVDVVVVGAGLAGLAVARRLRERAPDLDVLVVEASDGPGGRVRTDRQDGLLLDRGFQQFNAAYPEVRRVLDVDALDVRPFQPGASVRLAGRRVTLGDPLRWPTVLLSDLTAPLGPLRGRLAFARWAIEVGYGPSGRLKRLPDRSLQEELERRGVSADIVDGVLRPFLAGVLAESSLSTSRRFADLLIRSFVRGTPGLPAAGIGAMAEQLAAGLPVRYESPVVAVRPNCVTTQAGSVRCRAVAMAADPVTACRLTGLPEPGMKALTTFYFRAAEPPTDTRLIHLDGEHRGPVVNTAVVSNTAPTYAAGGALIASTVLGTATDADTQAAVRRQSAELYGLDPAASRDWDDVRCYVIPGALPVMPPPLALCQPVDLGDGLFVAGDHRDTASFQGALVSGRRAADAVLTTLGASRG